LILRPRVKGYRAGDLERHYESLGVEEDFFVNYGFVTGALQALMHPRPDSRAQRTKEKLLLDFVERRGVVHPREVEAHFAHGTVRNYWGGSSHATTQMLDALHYRGKLRVARREKGIQVYRTHQHEAGPLDKAARRARIDALVDVMVNLYAPLPGASGRGWTGFGLTRRTRGKRWRRKRCDCWRRSIPWSTIECGSSFCGLGFTDSKPIRRRRNGSWVTTHFRCSGAIA
jgi:uncharacterized protein YcaQ